MRSILNIVFIFLLINLSVKAQDIIVFDDSLKNSLIGGELEYLEDVYGDLKIEDIRESKDFLPVNGKVPNLGVSKSVYWFKIKIQNQTSSNLLINLAYPLIDYLDFYSFDTSGNLISKCSLGDLIKYENRLIDHQENVFSLRAQKGEIREIFFRVKSEEQLVIPLILGTNNNIYSDLINRDLFSGIYFGLILVIFLYNLFIYFSVKDKSYLFYVLYILFFGLTQAALFGYSFKFFFPSYPEIHNQSIILFPALAGISAIFFAKDFLRMKKYTPFLDKGLNLFIISYSIAVITALIGMRSLAHKIVDFTALLIAIYGLFFASVISYKGYRPAKFFLIAWIFFLAGLVIFVLRNFNIMPFNTFTSHVLQIGSGIEVVLLSIALADRINILKAEKEASQQEALKISLENEKLIREQNQKLEQMVTERTTELVTANTELEVTLKNLKDTQAQLVNQEKMASLGQLTAGIAHEINNPINFVTSNINPLAQDFEDIMQYLEKLEKIAPDNAAIEIEESKKLRKRLDIDYLRDEVRILLKGIDDGAKRTAEIVKGLRIFSRVDEMDVKKVDINECIDSTLTLLRNQFGHKTDLDKNLENEVYAECYPGKLNQVFMNIITNGLHAVDKKFGKNLGGKITISTQQDEHFVYIRIADNGIGMDDKTKMKIFEPFFTTKDVGEGTGLGLSIVYSIIESHNGKVNVNSEKGEGTEFVITLPKIQKT